MTQAGCSYEMVGSRARNYPDNPIVFTGRHEAYSGQRADHIRDGQDTNGNGVIDGSENPGIDIMMSTHSPDVVLLHIGSNDMNGGESVASTVSEILDIINKILTANSNAKIFVANVIPWYGSSSQFNSDVPGSVQLLGTQLTTAVNNLNNPNVVLTDVRSGFTQSMMQADLFHPNTTGEAHIADAFIDEIDNFYSCASQPIDLIEPETFISVPSVSSTVNSTTTYSGHATDAGGSGFDKVWIAIRDNADNWYNFTNGSFGAITQGGVNVGITNATLSKTTTTDTDWSITTTLPAGAYTFFALAIDNAGNDAFHNTGLAVWPVNRGFSVEASDSVKPVAETTSPSDGHEIAASLTNITGTASDNDSGVSAVRVRVQRLGVLPSLFWNGNTWTTTSTYINANLDASSTSWTLPNVDLSVPANYRIRVIAQDNAGNSANALDNPKTDFSVQ